MEISVDIKLNKDTVDGLKRVPDIALYTIAREVLDRSYDIIPKDTGDMRTSSMERGTKGVQGGNGDYFIGSYTDYASYVWNMNDRTTHWTEPNTHSQWFLRTIKEKGTVIVDDALTRAWKDTM